MWRIIHLVLFLSGLPVASLMSQNAGAGGAPDKPLRIEIPARSVNETYRILSCGPNGLIMFFRSQEAGDASRTKWYFSCYDTNFQQMWVKDVPLFNDQEFRFYHTGADTLSLLFVHAGKSKSPENVFEILRIVPHRGTLILNTGKLEDGAVVETFGVAKDRAWLGVNTKGLPGKIITVGLRQGTTRAFALGNGSQISILWMRADSSGTSSEAIVKRQISKKSAEYYLVRYDTNGVIRREVLISSQTGDRRFNRFNVVSGPNGTELLVGSYGQGESGSSKNRSSEESTGLFACPIVNGTPGTVNYYNFLELQNAGSLVGESDIMDLKKKALKKNKAIGEYSLDYSVLLHDVIVENNRFILTAECYTPQYHTENFTDFDFYGRPYTNSYSVFDGYRFFNAIAAGFDADGKLLWDNNIEIRNLVSFELSPKVVAFPAGNEMVLCYESDGKIGSKIIQESNVVEKLDFTAMDLLNPDDKLLTETKGALIHWYSNYFLCYGYQDIKNIALDSNNKRLVFYFSKLQFER